MKRCAQPHCRGSIVNEPDREACLLCGRVYRDDARVGATAYYALEAMGAVIPAHMTGTRSSKRGLTEALTDGLMGTKGTHDVV